MGAGSWKILFGGLLVGGLLAAHPAAAVTYDLKADFNNTDNPNGPWRYLAGTSVLPVLSGDWGGYGLGPGFGKSITPGPGFAPVIIRYDGSPTSGSVDASASDIIAHTQTQDSNFGDGDFSVKFTNPVAGLATISGNIWDAHVDIDRRQAWEILVNGVQKASGTLLGDGTEGSSNKDAFSLLPLLLSVGDTVVLRAVFTTGGTQVNGGLIGLNFTIDVVETSAVPLPAALPLMATGLGAMGWIGLRRRGKSA